MCLVSKGGIRSPVVYDLVKLVGDQYICVRLELLLIMLRELGPLLGMSDPAGLKGVIEFDLKHASSNTRKTGGADKLNKLQTNV